MHRAESTELPLDLLDASPDLRGDHIPIA
jgi:hypothetical protein